MKSIILILFFFLPQLVNTQPEKANSQHGLVVTGNVRSITIEKIRSSTVIKLALKIQFQNTGSVPIIFWNQKSFPRRAGDLINIKQVISRDQSFAPSHILDESDMGPSVSGNPEWQQISKSLNQKTPPSNLTTTIAPNQVISYDATAVIVCNQKRTDSFPEHVTFEELQNVGDLWLRIYYEAWSSNLEANPRKSWNLKFGRALQKQWKMFGNLQLDDIYTEPIKVDLKEAVFEK